MFEHALCHRPRAKKIDHSRNICSVTRSFPWSMVFDREHHNFKFLKPYILYGRNASRLIDAILLLILGDIAAVVFHSHPASVRRSAGSGRTPDSYLPALFRVRPVIPIDSFTTARDAAAPARRRLACYRRGRDCNLDAGDMICKSGMMREPSGRSLLPDMSSTCVGEEHCSLQPK